VVVAIVGAAPSRLDDDRVCHLTDGEHEDQVEVQLDPGDPLTAASLSVTSQFDHM
jgi:hypothetical protein